MRDPSPSSSRAGDAGGAPLTTVHVTCSLLDTDTRAGQGQQAALHDPRRELSTRLLIEESERVSWAYRRRAVPRGGGLSVRAFRRARSVCAERSTTMILLVM